MAKSTPAFFIRRATDLGDLLGAVVVGAGAADPVEHLGGALLVPLLDVHALRPGLAVALRHAPRVARLLHLLERLRGAEADLALGEGHVAAHVDDGGDVLVADRADLHAGAAGGARPQDVLVDDPARQEHGGVLGVELLALQRGLVAILHVMLEVGDQVHGLQGLAGEGRRAVVRAATALGAGQPVEDLLPAEVFQAAGAEVFDALVLGIDLQGADAALRLEDP
jgi:hypothetical protein